MQEQTSVTPEEIYDIQKELFNSPEWILTVCKENIKEQVDNFDSFNKQRLNMAIWYLQRTLEDIREKANNNDE